MKRIIAFFIFLCAITINATAQGWIGTWATAPQTVVKSFMPYNNNMSNRSVRQVVKVSIGGDMIRLKLSNIYSTEPVVIRSIYIAHAKDSFAIDPKSAKYLKFSNQYKVTIPAGKSITSDALPYDLKPLQRLAITINYTSAPTVPTVHMGSRTTSYIMKGVTNAHSNFVAGTNSVHNFEVDASEIFLQNGKLAAYLYAQSFNRDLWKKHDPNTDDNIFFELLLASPTPQFLGFELDEVSGEVLYLFGKMDANPEGMKEIQSGILDFVRDYQKHFSGYPYLFCVSGRDAYAPILAARGNKKAYLKALKKKFEFEANVL